MINNSPFSKIAHIGIVVRDIDKATKRLEALGIGPFKAVSLPPHTDPPTFRGKPYEPDKDNKTLIAKMGETELALIEPGIVASPWREFLDSKGEGIHHIAFMVDDPFKEMGELVNKGAIFQGGGKWKGGGSFYLDLGVGDLVFEFMR